MSSKIPKGINFSVSKVTRSQVERKTIDEEDVFEFVGILRDASGKEHKVTATVSTNDWMNKLKGGEQDMTIGEDVLKSQFEKTVISIIKATPTKLVQEAEQHTMHVGLEDGQVSFDPGVNISPDLNNQLKTLSDEVNTVFSKIFPNISPLSLESKPETFETIKQSLEEIHAKNENQKQMFEPVTPSKRTGPGPGIPNYLGYNCYLATVCQRMACSGRYDKLLNKELEVNVDNPEFSANLCRLQLLFRGVVNELRGNRKPEKNLITALVTQLQQPYTRGEAEPKPLFDLRGQQDATEALLLFSSLIGEEVDSVELKDTFEYEVCNEDIPESEKKETTTKGVYTYTGEIKQSETNFQNVLQATKSGDTIPEKLSESRDPEPKQALSFLQTTGTAVTDLEDFLFTDEEHPYDQETSNGKVVSSQLYERMRVLVLKDDKITDTFSHEQWENNKLNELTAEGLALQFPESQLVTGRLVKKTKEITKLPNELELYYQQGNKPLQEVDMTIELSNKTEYELVDVVWRSATGSGGGHYKYYHKNSEGNWHEYNDGNVNPMSKDEVVAACSKNCYSLLYHKKAGEGEEQ